MCEWSGVAMVGKVCEWSEVAQWERWENGEVESQRGGNVKRWQFGKARRVVSREGGMELNF